ncbi:unnamed protein product [Gadus morhua 'NCC']
MGLQTVPLSCSGMHMGGVGVNGMDGWIRDAGGEQIIQYLGRQMRRAENNYTKSQISIGGSVHSARSVTSCEKAHFMSSIVINNQHPLQRWSKALLRLHWRSYAGGSWIHYEPGRSPLPPSPRPCATLLCSTPLQRGGAGVRCPHTAHMGND